MGDDRDDRDDRDDQVPLSSMFGQSRPAPAKGRRRGWLAGAVALVVAAVVAVAAFGGAFRGHDDKTPVVAAPTPSASDAPSPTPAPTAEKQKPSKPELALSPTFVAAGPAPKLPWPDSGQAEVRIAGLGSLGHSGGSGPVPIASIAKVMTAYTVLRDHSGGRITVTADEAAKLEGQKANGESVVEVEAGEQLTLRQALTGLLVASGDNMAEILARWDAGSIPAFVARMNANAARLGMGSTHFADPSGLSAATVSTAHDLITLAPAAMAQPTLAQLVGTRTASMPLNPVLKNYNSLLGLHGVIGIKTGTTTAAGGCLLFAARRTVGSKTFTIYGAVLGIAGPRDAILSNARDAADALVVGAGDQLHRITVLRAGRPVVTYVDRSGTPVTLTTRDDVRVVGWSGQRFTFRLPRKLTVGRAAKNITVHTPTDTLTVRLVPSSA